jgi:hypothetical protein
LKLPIHHINDALVFIKLFIHRVKDFNPSFIRSFCPKRFDHFSYSPSIGASRGLIVLWNSAVFYRNLLEIHRSAIKIAFTSRHNGEAWTLVNVYGPCDGLERDILCNGFMI